MSPFSKKDWHDEIEATDTPISAAALEDVEERLSAYTDENVTTTAVRNGTGAPAEELGINGDFYIDTENDKIYGPKAAGKWGSGTSLIGPEGEVGATGTAGKTVLNGAGAPSNELGADGDFYLATSTYKIYGPKASGEWPAGVELKGAAGRNTGLKYTYSTSTGEADPETGKIRLNNATLSSATALYISETDGDEAAAATWIQSWDDSTSEIRGYVIITKDSAPQNFRMYKVTGSVSDKGTWDKVTIGHITGAGTFENGDSVRVAFTRTGDKGEAGESTTFERKTLSGASTWKTGNPYGESSEAYIVIERISGIINQIHFHGQVSYNASWTMPAELRPYLGEGGTGVYWNQMATPVKGSFGEPLTSVWVACSSEGAFSITKPTGVTFSSGYVDLTGISYFTK